WNILFNAGYAPTAAYIDSLRKDTYDSREEARTDFDRMLTDVIDPRRTAELAQAREKLEDWLDAELVPNETAGRINEKGRAEGRLKIAHPRTIRWGFLSWKPEPAR
ncbi:MAG: methyltransferase type 12, partial [Denitrobacterium sp.]|nr:methyltransferase type 12 [Denitrobacterium sp.]